MARIEIVEQSFRDGQQSLCGMFSGEDPWRLLDLFAYQHQLP